MIKRASFLIVILLVLGAFIVTGGRQSAQTGLVAVSEGTNVSLGSMANLYLEIKPGSGRVFLDTLPASKLDTQMSTRLAKSIACKYTGRDCSKYNFFYTIRADSAIVGGPSATAAAAIVTISILDDVDLKDDVVISGIITSGNLIGNVGGLKEKAQAAARAGISKFLIPKGQRMQPSPNLSDNTTTDLVELGKTYGIEIIEVGTLDEALEHFTGRRAQIRDVPLEADAEYQTTMKYLAERLCNRSDVLKKSLNAVMASTPYAILTDEDLSIDESARNLTLRAAQARENGNYYSMASFCFGSNVNYHNLLLVVQEPSRIVLVDKQLELERRMKEIYSIVDSYDIRTLTDLQTFMVVKARLMEAQEFLVRARDALRDNEERKSISNFAFATERVNSALAWSTFFGRSGQEFKMSEKDLKESCRAKLSETDEHYQYMDLVFPTLLVDVKKDLDKARDFQDEEEYVMCLYQATITKAQINVFASVIGVELDGISPLLERKLSAASHQIALQQEDDIFPILGYSYYEYAQELMESAPYSSLLYVEYALELGNLDIYFDTISPLFVRSIQRDWALVFLAGLTLGFIISEGIGLHERRSDMRKKKKGKKVQKKAESSSE